jgi:hypothetical protein
VGLSSPQTRRLSSYYYGAGTHRRLQSLQPTGHGRQLSGYYGYGPAAPGRRLMSVAAAAGRTLASYGYYGSVRLCCMPAALFL